MAKTLRSKYISTKIAHLSSSTLSPHVPSNDIKKPKTTDISESSLIRDSPLTALNISQSVYRLRSKNYLDNFEHKRTLFRRPTKEMEKLIGDLRVIFADDRVNIERVENLLSSYKSNEKDWAKFALFDEHRYTRNLVDVGNGKYNLMILCWGPGMGSSIHDHTDSHCFVKVLQGDLLETRFEWPHCNKVDKSKNETENPNGQEQTEENDEENCEQPMKQIESHVYPTNGVTYMSDEIGLHRMENPSHSEPAVSLHLYIPPFDHCNMFDQRTGRKSQCMVTFWSAYGEKIDIKTKMQMQKDRKPSFV